MEEIGIPAVGPLLVVGPTDGVAEALQTAGIPVTMSLQSGGVFGKTNLEPVVGVATNVGLVDDSVAAVVALAAWSRPSQVRAVAEEAVRITRPGGVVVLGDVDAGVLTTGPPRAFPASRFYRAHPAAAAALTARTAPASSLAIEAVRSRLDDVGAMTADRLIGVFGSASEYLAAIADGLWRGADAIDEATGSATAAAITSTLRYPAEDHQPWRFVRGIVP